MKTKQQIIDEAVKEFEEVYEIDLYDSGCNTRLVNEVEEWLTKSLSTSMDAAVEAVRLEERKIRYIIGDVDKAFNQAATQQSRQIKEFEK